MNRCQDEGATHHTGCDCHEEKWNNLTEAMTRFHDLAVKERDAERQINTLLRIDLEESQRGRLEWARQVGLLAKERAELRDRIGVLADRLENGASELRDAWKAEDRVRSVLRRLWAEVQDEDRCHLMNGHMISQPLWEEVEATLKEGEEI